jgi:ABC-2 type transport system ATP-binding protein
MSQSTIGMRELRKRYGAIDAVAGLSLDIGPGVTGLLGPNGAGKTTLMRMLATVLAPTEGHLRMLGLDPADPGERTDIRRQLGYRPQEPGFHRQFTAFEFVDYVAILKEMTDRRARHREVRRVLGTVGLDDVAGRRIRKLSGGMRRRVALAQALLGDPRLLVLDEPTAALDPEQRMRFRELASALGDERTVLVSTHQTEDVAALCQRVIVMREARGLRRDAGRAQRSRARSCLDRRRARRARAAVVAHSRGPPPPRRRPAGGGTARRSDDRGRLPAARRSRGRPGRGGGMSSATIAAPAAAAPPAARARSIRWTLARFEGRRLLLHPLFLFGMATTIAALALARSFAAERSMMLSGDCFVMLGGALWTYLAAFLAMSRERRDSAHDFYAGHVVTSGMRTQAALLSIGFAGLAGIALIAIATLAGAGFDGVVTIVPARHAGQPLPSRSYTLQLIELGQGPLYLVAAGVLGVLVGAWTRRVFAGAFGALLLFLPPLALLPRFVYDDNQAPGFYGSVQLFGPIGWEITAWHLVAVTGVAAIAAAAAIARHDRGAGVALLALLGLGAIVAGVAFLPRPFG